MIGRLNHVAIAVPDLARAAAVYRDTLGAEVSEPVPLAEHGVTTVFVELPNTKLELIEPPRRRLADRPLPRPQPGRRSAPRLLRGGRHPRGARPLRRRRRTGARRRRAPHRGARQAGAVPPSEGLLRDPHRDRAGLSASSRAAAGGRWRAPGRIGGRDEIDAVRSGPRRAAAVLRAVERTRETGDDGAARVRRRGEQAERSHAG